MTILDELLALPAMDRLAICLDVYQAAQRLNTKPRAEAMEMLFVAMAFTVHEQLPPERADACPLPLDDHTKKAPPRPKVELERKGAPSRSTLTHNPFAEALKNKGDRS